MSVSVVSLSRKMPPVEMRERVSFGDGDGFVEIAGELFDLNDEENKP